MCDFVSEIDAEEILPEHSLKYNNIIKDMFVCPLIPSWTLRSMAQAVKF